MDRFSIVKVLEPLQLPVFTSQQFASLLDMSAESAAVTLSRLAKDGVLTRIQRGHYSLPSTSIQAVATGIYAPSYISLLAAFEHYGVTTQSPRIIDVINSTHSGKKAVSLESGHFLLRFVKTHPRLLYGFKKIYYGEKVAFMADKERAVVDGLLFPEYVHLDEVVGAIRSGIDMKKAIDYGKRIKKQAVMKRMGYLLSAEGIKCSPDDFGKLSETYVPLDPSAPLRGEYDPVWRVVVNTVIE